MTGCRGGTGSRSPGAFGGKGLRRPIGQRMLELCKTDAENIAAMVMKETEHGERALLILPDGRVQILPPKDSKVRRALEKHPGSLVGIYDIFSTAAATEEDVAADVLAMSQAL